MRKLTVIILSTFVASCSTTHVHQENLDLRKGSSIQEFLAVERDYDEYKWKDKASGSEIRFFSSEIMKTFNLWTSYYYLFVDNKLYFFGTAQKFIKHPDPLVRRAMREGQVQMD